MILIREIAWIDWLLIGLFVVLYLTYLIRVTRVAGAIKSAYGRVFLKLPLRIIYFALMMLAFLGPSNGMQRKEEVKSIGKDIFICVDLSTSMNAHDVPPTRLEKIKYELKNLVKAFSTDRIGLIIFSSEAFRFCFFQT